VDEQKLRQLLAMEEGPKLDFKAELHLSTESEKKELVKDVIAIANTRGGRGYILFGVEDKTRRLLGFDEAGFHEEQIQQIIYNRSDPPVPVQVEFQRLDGVPLMVLTIFRSQHRPHQMMQTGAFYVRRGSTTDVARRGELAGMLQENGLFTLETVPVTGAEPDDLLPERLAAYVGGLPGDAGKPSETLLEALGFLTDRGNGRLVPTVGGLLLFGRHPEVFFPQHHIRLTNGEWVEVVHGCIPVMLDEAMRHAGRMIASPEWPMEALEEALANALAHRDYLDWGRGIEVDITDQHVVVTNPGSMQVGNGPIRRWDAETASRRNPWLYQRLLGIDAMNRFHRTRMGTKRIMQELARYGSVRFLNLGDVNLFKVVMPGPDAEPGR